MNGRVDQTGAGERRGAILRPVALRVERVDGAMMAGGDDRVGCNSEASVFSVETDAFVGRIHMRLRGLPDEPTEYFEQRGAVRLSGVVQGRFKRQDLTCADCVTGYEFDRPFVHVPARMLVRAGLRIVQSFAPTMSHDVLGPRPFVLNPMFQTIQVLHVARPGDEPPLTGVLEENTTLLGGVFADRAVPPAERKRYFECASRGAQHAIDASHVYTMEFHEDKIDPKTFELLLMGRRFQLSRYLGDQPLSYPMGKLGRTTHGGEYLFRVFLHREGRLEV